MSTAAFPTPAVPAVPRVALPTIPLSIVPSLIDADGRLIDGRFLFDVGTDGRIIPIAIRVRRGATVLGMAVLHEVGHFLDASGLPGRGEMRVSQLSILSWKYRRSDGASS